MLNIGIERENVMECVKNEVSNDYYIMMAECMIHMLQDVGFTLKKNMRILDFGCGNGEMVQAFLSLGYDTYGVDIIDCPSLDASHYKKIGFNPYRIPYSEDSFDLVYSSSVFEHTQNTEECFREIYRVLKWGGQLSMLYQAGIVFWNLIYMFHLAELFNHQCG